MEGGEVEGRDKGRDHYETVSIVDVSPLSHEGFPVKMSESRHVSARTRNRTYRGV